MQRLGSVLLYISRGLSIVAVATSIAIVVVKYGIAYYICYNSCNSLHDVVQFIVSPIPFVVGGTGIIAGLAFIAFLLYCLITNQRRRVVMTLVYVGISAAVAFLALGGVLLWVQSGVPQVNSDLLKMILIGRSSLVVVSTVWACILASLQWPRTGPVRAIDVLLFSSRGFSITAVVAGVVPTFIYALIVPFFICFNSCPQPQAVAMTIAQPTPALLTPAGTLAGLALITFEVYGLVSGQRRRAVVVLVNFVAGAALGCLALGALFLWYQAHPPMLVQRGDYFMADSVTTNFMALIWGVSLLLITSIWTWVLACLQWPRGGSSRAFVSLLYASRGFLIFAVVAILSIDYFTAQSPNYDWWAYSSGGGLQIGFFLPRFLTNPIQFVAPTAVFSGLAVIACIAYCLLNQQRSRALRLFWFWVISAVVGVVAIGALQHQLGQMPIHDTTHGPASLAPWAVQFAKIAMAILLLGATLWTGVFAFLQWPRGRSSHELTAAGANDAG